MDEIFSSTNYKEGFSAAYSIIKKLVSMRNNVSVITTNYTDLSKLEKDCLKGQIINYKVCINRGIGGILEYLYKIRKGISKDYVALEIMNEKGFDKDIVQDAINISKKISMPISD